MDKPPAGQGSPSPPPGVPGLVDARVLRRFSQRIVDELAARPLALDAEVHRGELKGLLRRLLETNHYELLGVEPGATPDQVHAAFLELARKVHPSHAETLGLEQWRGALDLLFERVTEGYLVLSDAERSKAYREIVPLESKVEVQPGGVVGPAGEERRQEQRDVSRRNFGLARDMAQRGEYHFAVELLNRAVLIDPQPEYYRLLADCQMENPRWHDKAIDNYARAVEGSPTDPELQVALGLACERDGRLERALGAFREALTLLPSHQVAIASLARVQQRAREERGGGALGRLRDWMKG
jgi:tetratricopeptide (TPR) repeat protein